MVRSISGNNEMCGYELAHGVIRFFGWMFAVLSTYRLGLNDPRVLLLYAFAVSVEVAGLIVNEHQNSTAGYYSGWRKVFISVEVIAVIFLLIHGMIGLFPGTFHVAVDGTIFSYASYPLMEWDIPMWIYMVMFFSPILCAMVWTGRAAILCDRRKRRSLYKGK